MTELFALLALFAYGLVAAWLRTAAEDCPAVRSEDW